MQDLPIWVTEIPMKDGDTKGIFRSSAEAVLRRIPADTLQKSLRETCRGMVTALKDVRDDLGEVGGFKLKQVAIQVEINAEGGVEIIGTAKVGAKGAITLTFGE